MSSQSHPSQLTKVRLCQGCELPVDVIDVKQGRSAIARVAEPNFIKVVRLHSQAT
ncbi:paraquat-inducible protein A [Vibrio ponticus]|nr:paraquat-inducible protein A [Vibrio ponticus]